VGGLLAQISWTGLLGGLAGALAMAAIAISVVIDPGEGSRWWAAVFAAVALTFVPAIWASVAPTPRRLSIQRATTVACIVLAALGVLSFGIGFAALLAVPTTLLAIASGYIFQGTRGRR
jgi:phosphatidylserine synthase